MRVPTCRPPILSAALIFLIACTATVMLTGQSSAADPQGGASMQSLDVVKEDDKLYYKVYKPVAAPKPAPVAQVSPQEQRRIRDSYRVNVPASTRLRFTPFGQGLPASGQWREGFAIADMNGDGHPDIVSGPPRKAPGAGPAIFLGNGKGSWSRWREAKFPPLAYDYGDAQVGDFNGDGHPDLALAVHLRGLIALLGDGKGGFSDSSEGLDFALGGKSAFSSTALRLVDWNGDGRPDILALGEGPGLMGGRLVHSSRGVSLYHNLGDGKWERHASAAPNQIFGDSIAMGDFDGSGHPGFATSASVQDRRDLVNLPSRARKQNVDAASPGVQLEAGVSDREVGASVARRNPRLRPTIRTPSGAARRR